MLPTLKRLRDARFAFNCLFSDRPVELREDANAKYLYLNADIEPRFAAPDWPTLYRTAFDNLVAERVAEQLRSAQQTNQ